MNRLIPDRWDEALERRRKDKLNAGASTVDAELAILEAVADERVRQERNGYDDARDLLHEPAVWLSLLTIQLGELADAIMAPPDDLPGREAWFNAMKKEVVHLMAVALAFGVQLEMRLEGLKEQGKEGGKG